MQYDLFDNDIQQDPYPAEAHYCLGAALPLLEERVAFEELLEGFPERLHLDLGS